MSYVIKYGYIMLYYNIMSYHKSYPIASHDVMWMYLNLLNHSLIIGYLVAYDVYNIKNAAMNIFVYHEILSSSPVFYP